MYSSLGLGRLVAENFMAHMTKDFCKNRGYFHFTKYTLHLREFFWQLSCVCHISFHKRLPWTPDVASGMFLYDWTPETTPKISNHRRYDSLEDDQDLWPWFPWRTTFCMWSSCDSNIHRPHTQHLHQHVNNAIRGLNLLVRFRASPVPSCC